MTKWTSIGFLFGHQASELDDGSLTWAAARQLAVQNRADFPEMYGRVVTMMPHPTGQHKSGT